MVTTAGRCQQRLRDDCDQPGPARRSAIRAMNFRAIFHLLARVELCSRHPGSGPHHPWIAIAVPNERLIIHGEGFNFLTFASSLHADWTIGGRRREIVSFFFKSSGHYAATPCGRSYNDGYLNGDSERLTQASGRNRDHLPDAWRGSGFSFSFDRRRAQTWKSAVLKPSDSSTTAAHTLFSSKKPSDTGPRTCGGLFLSRKPGRQPGLVPSESGS